MFLFILEVIIVYKLRMFIQLQLIWCNTSEYIEYWIHYTFMTYILPNYMHYVLYCIVLYCGCLRCPINYLEHYYNKAWYIRNHLITNMLLCYYYITHIWRILMMRFCRFLMILKPLCNISLAFKILNHVRF